MTQVHARGDKPGFKPVTKGLTAGAIADSQVVVARLSQQEIEEIQHVFDLFDTSGDKKIDKNELYMAMKSLGMEYSRAEVDDLMVQVDTDRSGFITFDEFLQIMGAAKMNADVHSQLEEVFREFDVDGDGMITENDLLTAMRNLGQNLSAQDCDIILNDSKFDASPCFFLILVFSVIMTVCFSCKCSWTRHPRR